MISLMLRANKHVSCNQRCLIMICSVFDSLSSNFIFDLDRFWGLNFKVASYSYDNSYQVCDQCFRILRLMSISLYCSQYGDR